MKRVTGPGLPGGKSPDPGEGAWYNRLADTDFVGTLELRNADNEVLLKTTRDYLSGRDLLWFVKHEWLGGVGIPPAGPLNLTTYRYAADDPAPAWTHDALGHRTAVALSGAAFSAGYTLDYGYNDRNELTSAAINQANPPTWTYTYDPIGSRTAATDVPAENETTYVAIRLNQYLRAMTAHGGKNIAQGFRHDADGNLAEEYVAADMNCDESLDYFDIDPFLEAVFEPATWHANYPNCNILNGDLDGDGAVTFFDIDGFLDAISIGGGGLHREYRWDAENRLTAVIPLAPVPGAQRVEYEYDYIGRRAERRVFDWDPDANGGAGAWQATPSEKQRYVWDGWLQLAELDALNLDAQSRPKLLKTHVWGLDLSGSREGAAGIGGLLAAADTRGTTTATDDVAAAYCYDANGNVTQLVDWRQTAVTPNSDEWGAARLIAAYEYDPYGSVVAQSGSYSNDNPWQYETSPIDLVPGTYHRGSRHYQPTTGRWQLRDLVGESADHNVYRFVNNTPLNLVDPFGLTACNAAEHPCSCCVKSFKGNIAKFAGNLKVTDYYPRIATPDGTIIVEASENLPFPRAF